MDDFTKTLKETTAYLIGTKDKETVDVYKDTVFNLCKMYHINQQRELLLAFIEWHAKEPFTRDEFKDLTKRVDRYLS